MDGVERTSHNSSLVGWVLTEVYDGRLRICYFKRCSLAVTELFFVPVTKPRQHKAPH